MNELKPDEWICQANCSFYKPDRIEEDRCRGFSLALNISGLRPLSELKYDSEAFDSSFLKLLLRSIVCESCPFYIDGCDFTSVDPPENCLPCGGLIVLSKALKTGQLSLSDLRLSNLSNLGEGAYLRLNNNAALKYLEEPCIYNITEDELYEVNEEGFGFLKRCDGESRIEFLKPDRDFVEFCVAEGLIDATTNPSPRKLVSGRSPNPSLRYLEWLVTFKCNLKCAHCYLGEDHPEEFPDYLMPRLLEELSLMQGLRVLVSGGEPTLYKHFGKLNELAPEYPLRFVLLSNGMMIDKAFARSLNFNEVQISLDGMQKGHEIVRGKGTFVRVLNAIESIKNAGLDLSVATMIHSGNLDEWEQMRKLLESYDIREWSIDYPCVKGRFVTHPELAVSLSEAAKRMEYGFGGSYHGSSAGWTCGRHLAAVLPSGKICRCGLYPEKILGTVENGLSKAWEKVKHIPIRETECKDCEKANDCGGGCRYRAGGPLERDAVMCALYGETSV